MEVELLGGSFDYQKLSDLTNKMSTKPAEIPAAARVDDIHPSAPQVSVTVAVTDPNLRVVGRECLDPELLSGATYVNQSTNSVRYFRSMYRPIRSSAAAGRAVEPLCAQPGQPMVPIGAVRSLDPRSLRRIYLYNLFRIDDHQRSGARASVQARPRSIGGIAKATLPSDVSTNDRMVYQEKLTGSSSYTCSGLSVLLVYSVSRPVRKLDFCPWRALAVPRRCWVRSSR